MARMTVTSVEWAGKRYTAEVRESDQTLFGMPCKSHGTRRCAIEAPHSTYMHLVIGAAENWGIVETI